MTLAEKIGQLLLTGIDGQTPHAATQALIADLHVGGIILRQRNVISAGQLKALTSEINRGRAPPLLIAVDHEGGDVIRIPDGVTPFPSAMALGAARSPELAFAVGQASALELRALGVNVNLAPVLDVNTQPDNPVIGLRSFGDDPQLAADLGTQFMLGALAGGALPVVKHFPGHGGVRVDSHAGLPAIAGDRAALEAAELAPFRAAIAAGAPAVMVGHLWAPALDPVRRPASLSPAVMTDLLRAEMGFDGVILTDSFNMGAITNEHSIAEAAVIAVLAGADVVMVAEPSDARAAQAALLAAAQSGQLSEARIDESVRRILGLKAWLAGARAPAPDPAAHADLAARVAQASVTAGGAEIGTLRAETRALLIAPLGLDTGSAPNDGATLLGELLEARGVSVAEVLYDPHSDDPAAWDQLYAQVRWLASRRDVVIIGLRDAALRFNRYGERGQIQLVGEALASGKPVVVAGLGLPYDRAVVPETATFVAVYGDTPAQLAAFVRLLTAWPRDPL